MWEGGKGCGSEGRGGADLVRGSDCGGRGGPGQQGLEGKLVRQGPLRRNPGGREQNKDLAFAPCLQLRKALGHCLG